VRSVLTWGAVALAVTLPILAAAASPLLAFRESVYIAAGLAGVVAFGLLLVQPLLAGLYLPGLRPRPGRRLHGWVGAGLLACVVIHVGGLWLTSPPDVIDALLLRSPTPFSIWGVVAMWALFATALLALLRRRLRLMLWRLCHVALAVLIVAGTILHALLIEGTMEPFSKLVLSALVAAALVRLLTDLPLMAGLRRLTGRAGGQG
jgi:hypothetical protein